VRPTLRCFDALPFKPSELQTTGHHPNEHDSEETVDFSARKQASFNGWLSRKGLPTGGKIRSIDGASEKSITNNEFSGRNVDPVVRARDKKPSCGGKH
jgi:hypothetical protein